MKWISFSVLMVFSSAVLCSGLYRWTDAQGNVHYSDSVPPRASQSGHKVITREGDILQEIEARKTAEQLASERRLAQQRADLLKSKKERELHDATLLGTFSSVEELDQIRDQRLKTLASRIKISQAKLEQRKEKVNQWIRERDALKAKGQPVPVQLNDNIHVLNSQALQTQNKIIRLYASKETISERFRKDRARFVELMPPTQQQ